jgi:hypothetical protein
VLILQNRCQEKLTFLSKQEARLRESIEDYFDELAERLVAESERRKEEAIRYISTVTAKEMHGQDTDVLAKVCKGDFLALGHKFLLEFEGKLDDHSRYKGI